MLLSTATAPLGRVAAGYAQSRTPLVLFTRTRSRRIALLVLLLRAMNVALPRWLLIGIRAAHKRSGQRYTFRPIINSARPTSTSCFSARVDIRSRIQATLTHTVKCSSNQVYSDRLLHGAMSQVVGLVDTWHLAVHVARKRACTQALRSTTSASGVRRNTGYIGRMPSAW